MPPTTLKDRVKTLAYRALRPGLADVNLKLDKVEQLLHTQAPVAGAIWRGGLTGVAVDSAGREAPAMTVKYRDELAYWEHVVKRDSVHQFGGPFEDVFGAWQRDRMIELKMFLDLPDDGAFEEWCRARSVVEIGAGPYPSICVKQWKRAVAVDPLADGYTAEGLLPKNAHCDEVVYIAAAGESVPLPSGFADIVVAENCLDHVDDPWTTVREIRRLLSRDGLLWLLVDLMEYKDHLHPNPFSETSLRHLLSTMGFTPVKDRVSDHKSHPNAYGEYRGLLRLNGGA